MRQLLFFILFVLCCPLIVQANTTDSSTSTAKKKEAPSSHSHETSTKIKSKSKQKKGFAKSIFTPSLKEEKNKNVKPPSVKKNVIEIDQLKEIIDSLPEQDKKTIASIRQQIATWPKEVFDEISDYRAFIISSRKIAQQKYDLLSPEAKSALETEKVLKSKLSQDTVKTLENLEVDIN